MSRGLTVARGCHTGAIVMSHGGTMTEGTSSDVMWTHCDMRMEGTRSDVTWTHCDTRTEGTDSSDVMWTQRDMRTCHTMTREQRVAP